MSHSSSKGSVIGEEFAFPLNTANIDNPGAYEPRGGMSKREYFAARAPHAPQPWFDPVMSTPKPTVPALASISDKRIRDDVDVAMDAGTDPQTPEGAEWLAQHIEAYEARNAWLREREKQRCIQWPWAWADAVLESSSLRAGDKP